MSFTNKTDNLGLPQWLADDKPSWLVDMNGAFSAIDSARGEQITKNAEIDEAQATTNANVKTNTDAITAANTEIEAIEARVTEIEGGSVTKDLDEKVSTLETTVSTIESNVTENTDDLTTLKTTVQTLADDQVNQTEKITDNTEHISTIESSIEDINTNVTTINTQVTTNSADIATNTSSIETLQTNILSNTTSINSMKTDIESNSDSIEELKNSTIACPYFSVAIKSLSGSNYSFHSMPAMPILLYYTSTYAIIKPPHVGIKFSGNGSGAITTSLTILSDKVASTSKVTIHRTVSDAMNDTTTSASTISFYVVSSGDVVSATFSPTCSDGQISVSFSLPSYSSDTATYPTVLTYSDSSVMKITY